MAVIEYLTFSAAKLIKQAFLIVIMIIMSPLQSIQGTIINSQCHVAKTNSVKQSQKLKRSIENLPRDAQHLQRINSVNINIFGTNYGAFITTGSQLFAVRVEGVKGHVTDCIVGDRLSKQDYTIYFQVQKDVKLFEYYLLKVDHINAQRVHGLPDDATFVAIFDFSGLILFHSSDGMYQVSQGDSRATKIDGRKVIRVAFHATNSISSGENSLEKEVITCIIPSMADKSVNNDHQKSDTRSISTSTEGEQLTKPTNLNHV